VPSIALTIVTKWSVGSCLVKAGKPVKYILREILYGLEGNTIYFLSYWY